MAENELETLKRRLVNLEAQAEAAEARAEKAEEKFEKHNGPTTFLEFIQNCHQQLSVPLKIESDTTRTTQGSITKPDGRLCPTYLRPWDDFHELQGEVYQKALDILGLSTRCLSSYAEIESLGRKACGRTLASEMDLLVYERRAVEEPVSDILSQLRAAQTTEPDFPLGTIQFDNHANTFDDDDDPEASTRKPKRRKTNADQFCVHQTSGEADRNRLLFIIEYKAAHKLTTRFLRAGLRPMNLWQEVVQQATYPTDDEEKHQYNAERLTGIAVTQAYSYMIHEGLPYACLTTGPCIVFLHVKEAQPQVLYYFLAEPNSDVRSIVSGDPWAIPMTAVGRLLSLCLMSLSSPLRDHEWRNWAEQQAHTWEADFEYILGQISEEDRRESLSGSEYMPSPSPQLISAGRKRRTKESTSCRPTSDDHPENHSGDDSDNDGSHNRNPPVHGPYETWNRPPQPFLDPPKGRPWRGSGSARQTAPMKFLEFCTQHCLGGLCNGGRFDEACPNFALHRTAASGDTHEINSARLAELLRQQLNNNIDYYCTPCGRPGIRGAPFKLTLMPYGYTFIGKGTTDHGWKEVQREAKVYQVLNSLQGSAVPIFLGTVNIQKVYFLHGGARIKHFLLLSWGGKQANLVKAESEVKDSIRKSLRDIRRLGIQHNDITQPLGCFNWPNILWNSEVGRVQLIDFHRAKLIRSQEKSPLKRKQIYMGGNGASGSKRALV